MNSRVNCDMDWSSAVFESVVWPMIVDVLGGGELLRMENRPDVELARLLDMKAGIDGWQIRTDGMRGIAARVQTDCEYRTFTVRRERDSGAKTEYEKRAEAIYGNNGLIYPTITVQAYRVINNEGIVVSVGVARTKDVFDFIRAGYAKQKRTSNAWFFVAPWDDMRQRGFRVHQHRHVTPIEEGQS